MRGTGRYAMLFYHMSENPVCDALTLKCIFCDVLAGYFRSIFVGWGSAS
jgi:hypothetical protein